MPGPDDVVLVASLILAIGVLLVVDAVFGRGRWDGW